MYTPDGKYRIDGSEIGCAYSSPAAPRGPLPPRRNAKPPRLATRVAGGKRFQTLQAQRGMLAKPRPAAR